MFAEYVYHKAPTYSNKILLINCDFTDKVTDCFAAFSKHEFEVINYKNDLDFRINYYDKLTDDSRVVIVADEGAYIPFDIRKKTAEYNLTFSELFPKLNSSYLKEHPEINYDLLCLAYKDYNDYTNKTLTEQFIERDVNGQSNKISLLRFYWKNVCEGCKAAKTYADWFKVSEMKARTDILAVECEMDVSDEDVSIYFHNFIMNSYGSLYSSLSRETPVLNSKAMEYMHDSSERFAVIVMDGMSEFDWQIISKSFDDITYSKTGMFSMIPTTTSVSRQCLLSNKYPTQLLNPWSQSKEKEEFINCAKMLGYTDNQIEYHRGYDVSVSMSAKCVAIIINDIDDMVHGQKQGVPGMYSDINLYAKKKELYYLVKDLLLGGLDVYITADHGNTKCVGSGKFVGAGVEVETKSHRFSVLKDFADKDKIMSKYGMFEYDKKYYLDKQYDYLICYPGKSLDAPGEEVMTHGGTTIDEVIVPFIKIKAGENNG